MKFIKIEKFIHVCESCYHRFSRNEHPESDRWTHHEDVEAPYMSCDECGRRTGEDDSCRLTNGNS